MISKLLAILDEYEKFTLAGEYANMEKAKADFLVTLDTSFLTPQEKLIGKSLADTVFVSGDPVCQKRMS